MYESNNFDTFLYFRNVSLVRSPIDVIIQPLESQKQIYNFVSNSLGLILIGKGSKMAWNFSKMEKNTVHGLVVAAAMAVYFFTLLFAISERRERTVFKGSGAL